VGDRRCHSYRVLPLSGANDLLFAQVPTTKMLLQPKDVSELLALPKDGKEYRMKTDGKYSTQK
jgi:hypothetical protein